MKYNKEIEEIIKASKGIKGLEGETDDDFIQAFEDEEWSMLRMDGDDWED